MQVTARMMFVTALAFALAACNTSSVKPLSEKDVATFVPADNPDKGYVVGAFSVHGNNPSKIAKMFGAGGSNFEYTGYYYFFRQLNTPEGIEPVTGTVKFDSRPMFGGKGNSDFEVEDGRGHVLVMPLAAGDYEFYSWRIYSNNGQMESSWESREDYSIPFSITPGKGLYMGELRVEHTFGKNMFNMIIPAGGIFTCFDEYDRDMPLLNSDYPFLQNIEVERAPICDGLREVYRELLETAGDEQG